jgi:glyoxylase-like metal-dependent hydrolase (beta-lactamase superfamily II)
VNIELVLAPNPGLMTGPGTNTWILSSGEEAIVIDPGPRIVEHEAAIERALEGLIPVGVLVTHTHPDHAPAANPLAERFGAPAIGFDHGPEFSPDHLIADGESVAFGAAAAVCVTTPGHTPDSVSYRVGDALFTGDHIMGGSTVVIEDMTDYLDSLYRLLDTGLAVIHPGHGPVIDAPDELITEYIEHRLERERQIVAALASGARTLGEIVLDVYSDVDPALHPVAAMSVTAHLDKLAVDGMVVCDTDPTWDTEVRLA